MLLAKNIMSFRLVDNFMVYLLLQLVDFVYLITINSFFSVFLWVCGLLWSKICCSSNNDPSWPSHVSSTSRLTLNDKFQCLLVFFIMELCTQIWTSNQGELGIRQYTEGGHIWWVFLESVPVVLFFSYLLVWLTVPIELFPGHFHIFVGDLSSEVNDATLYACFSAYPSCS